MKLFAEIITVLNKYTNLFFLNVVEEPVWTDNNEIFLFSILFWYRLTSIIQFKNSKTTLETWNPEDTSLFIKKHKHDYMEVAKKYEISETNARNIFVNRRANITLLQMRKMVKNVNSEEFFIPADETTDGIEVVGEKDSYVGLEQTVSSYAYRRKCPVVVDKINSGNPFEEILAKFNQIF